MSNVARSELEVKLIARLKNDSENLTSYSDVFGWLGALFGQIADGSPRADELARMGQFLADEWCDNVNSAMKQNVEQLEKMLAAAPSLKKAA